MLELERLGLELPFMGYLVAILNKYSTLRKQTNTETKNVLFANGSFT